MKNSLYRAFVQYYLSLEHDRNECIRERNEIETRYRELDRQMIYVNDILCKYGSHISEHFEEGVEPIDGGEIDVLPDHFKQK